MSNHNPAAPVNKKSREKLRAKAREWRLRILRHPFSALIRLATILCVAVTAFLFLQIVGSILVQGIPNLSWDLFSPKFTTDNQSLLPSLINTFIITFLSLLIAVPIGIGGAVYLSEYSKRNSVIVKAIRITAETLAGIPSIIYGLFGMVFFVIALGFGMSMLAGALTLSLMILPLIMRTTEEALLSVPTSYREGSYGLGAGKLRTVFRIVLPPAAPGIFAGVVLAIGRIVGETAALLFTAGTVAKMASGISSSGSTLAVHMYMLSSEGLFIGKAYAAATVLLVFVLTMNGISRLISRKIVKE